MELLHDGWPVHEAQLRAKVGDVQVDEWLRDGTLYYGEPEPLPPAFYRDHRPVQIGTVTPDPTLTVTPSKKAPPRA